MLTEGWRFGEENLSRDLLFPRQSRANRSLYEQDGPRMMFQCISENRSGLQPREQQWEKNRNPKWHQKASLRDGDKTPKPVESLSRCFWRKLGIKSRLVLIYCRGSGLVSWGGGILSFSGQQVKTKQESKREIKTMINTVVNINSGKTSSSCTQRKRTKQNQALGKSFLDRARRNQTSCGRLVWESRTGQMHRHMQGGVGVQGSHALYNPWRRWQGPGFGAGPVARGGRHSKGSFLCRSAPQGGHSIPREWWSAAT